MARLSLVALLTLAFSGVAFATPVDSDLRARDSVPFLPCRACGFAFVTEPVESDVLPCSGHHPWLFDRRRRFPIPAHAWHTGDCYSHRLHPPRGCGG